MTLRPVTPGHVAVRPRPTARNPKAWCIVTVGPVKHYRRVVEHDVNPADPQVFLHCYDFVSREVALYAARHILRRGWLATCDVRIGIGPEAERSACLLPLGHAGKHGNSFYQWDDKEITFDTFPATEGREEFYRGRLEMWPDDGRCPVTDLPLGEGLRCQLPAGHEQAHHVHEDEDFRTRWLDLAMADRIQQRNQ